MREEEAMRGTLVRGIGSFYTVRTPEGQNYVVRAKKKFRYQNMTPMVGDEVMFLPGEGEDNGWLEAILPRSSECIRPPVANVSLLMLVVSPQPEPDLMLMDRLMMSAHRQQIRLCMAVTKSDLDHTLYERLSREYRDSGMEVLPVSSVTGQGDRKSVV